MVRAHSIWQMATAAALFAASVSVLWSVVGRAEGHQGGSTQDIYILRSPGKTTLVAPSAKKIPDGSVYMRMPDQFSEPGAVLSDNHNGQQKLPVRFGEKGSKQQRVPADRRHTGKSHITDLAEVPPHPGTSAALQGKSKSSDGGLIFGAAKIKGLVRLPRVKFARVGIPMELRDEAPSLDFTEKTLKDSGY